MSYVLDITPHLCRTSTRKTQNQSANEQQELTIRQHCGACKHTCYVEEKRQAFGLVLARCSRNASKRDKKKDHTPKDAVPVRGNKKRLLLVDTVALVESLDTAGRVNNLLLARVERMASGADFNLQVLGCGLGLDHVATRAMDLTKLIIGMNTFLHNRPPTLCTSAG